MGKPPFFLAFAVLVGSLLAAGCKNGVTNQAPSFTGYQGWAVENIDPTYWTKSSYPYSATMFAGFWVRAEDSDGVQDITYIRVTAPDSTYWVLQDTEAGISHYDPGQQQWGGWGYYRTSYPHSFLLGSYEVLLKDSAENQITTTIPFCSPAGTSWSGFVYSEDYTGSTLGGIPALARAGSLGGVKGADQITVSFTVVDSRVNEGYVWLYDSSEKYIGWTGRFGGIINSGAGIHTNGAPNTLLMSSGQLELDTGHAFSEVAGFHVVLTDGSQYSSPEAYDHRSIAAYKEF